MLGWKNCRFARMSSGRYCLIRDLGLVKGGKGLRHHEVLIAFSVRAALQRCARLISCSDDSIRGPSFGLARSSASNAARKASRLA
jgi:hypothetical protein